MPISATSHAFASGDTDYINNLNLVRADVGTLITDANTQGTMYTQNANAVAITGGTLAGMTSIATTGNVSIGTATISSYKLDVPMHSIAPSQSGSVRFGPSDAFGVRLSSVTDAGGVPQGKVLGPKDGNGYLSVHAGSSDSESMRFSANLSIKATLHPIAASQSNYFGFGPSTAYGVRIYSSTTGGGIPYGEVRGPLDGNGWLAFNTGAADAERLRVTATGNVLIATTTDNAVDKLQVNGTVNATSPAGGATGTQLVTAAWVLAKGYATTTGTMASQNSNAVSITGGTITGSTTYSAGQVVSSGGLYTTSSTAAIGYGTGSGSTVTQLTSKSTGVTIARPTGLITMNNAALAAGAKVTFLATCAAVGTYDCVVVCPVSNGSYRASACVVGGTGFYVTVENITGGSLSDALQLNYTLIAGSWS